MKFHFFFFSSLYFQSAFSGAPVVHLAGTGDVDWLLVLACAGQTNSTTTLDLFLPTSGDRQDILRGHGGATRRPKLATRWRWRRLTWPECRGVKNNYIFGIPNPYLPIHYATFKVLRWRLRVVYWSKFYNGQFSSKVQKIVFEVYGGKISRCNPARKSIPIETCRWVQKWRRYSQKCVLQSLQEICK